MVIVPIMLFGGIVPYTHGKTSAGFTTMGYVALAVLALILSMKLRSAIKKRNESLGRGVILLMFPVGWWIIVKVGISKLVTLVNNISEYWNNVLGFILLGGIFYIIAETIGEDGDSK